MKHIFTLISLCFLGACSSYNTQEIEQAEQLFRFFHCQNIEQNHSNDRSLTNFYQRSLASSKRKAQAYIDSYQHGDKIFALPLPDVIETQLQTYNTACQALGGVLPNAASDLSS